MEKTTTAAVAAQDINNTLAPQKSRGAFFGIALASLASVFWGGMGVSVQYLFENSSIQPLELVGLRLLTAGFLLVAINFAVARKVLMAPFPSRAALFGIALSGLEILGGHLTFFLAIYYSNAGTGAIFLALVPLAAGFYLVLRGKKSFTRKELFCCTLAFFGVLLLVSKGNFLSFDLNWQAVFWGLVCVGLSTVYSIQPKALIDKWGVIPVVSWGLLFGGIVGFSITMPWDVLFTFNLAGLAAFLFIVVFGTVAAFWLYLESLKYLSPVIVGLVVCLEPLSAFIFGVAFMGLKLGLAECLGIAMVLANVVILSMGTGPKKLGKRKAAQKDG